MCELCNHALGDDHNEVGVCLKCCLHGGPCFNPIGDPLPPRPPAWVVLWAFVNGKATPVEMLGVTTMEYAAKRIAEAAHFDPDAAGYQLASIRTRQMIPPADLALTHDGEGVLLVVETIEEVI